MARVFSGFYPLRKSRFKFSSWLHDALNAVVHSMDQPRLITPVWLYRSNGWNWHIDTNTQKLSFWFQGPKNCVWQFLHVPYIFYSSQFMLWLRISERQPSLTKQHMSSLPTVRELIFLIALVVFLHGCLGCVVYLLYSVSVYPAFSLFWWAFCWDRQVKGCQGHQNPQGDQCGFHTVRVSGGWTQTLTLPFKSLRSMWLLKCVWKKSLLLAKAALVPSRIR